MGIGDMIQAERDAEDAKRYRWLRDRVRAAFNPGHLDTDPVQLVFQKRSEPFLKGYQKRVDDAIDAAMRAAEMRAADQPTGDT